MTMMQAATPKSTASNKSRRRDTDDSRAERKRIQDRLAQRATRERTKNRIAYLEQRLSSLEAGDKQGEIANLTRAVDKLRNDNHRLRNALLKMRTNVDQALLTTDEQSATPSATKSCGCSGQSDCACPQMAYKAPTPDRFEPTPRNDTCNDGRHDSVSTDATEVAEVVNGHGVSSTTNLDLSHPDVVGGGITGLEDFFDFNPTALLEAFEMGATSFGSGWSPQAPSPFEYHFPAPETVSKIAPDTEKWHVSNGAFISCLDSVKQRTASTSTLDMHVPFKAVIWGWDNVGPEAQHPVWAALRQVDQRVFGTWTSKAQRIALMYICQTLIQYRENPTKENLDRVPVFLRPRYA